MIIDYFHSVLLPISYEYFTPACLGAHPATWYLPQVPRRADCVSTQKAALQTLQDILNPILSIVTALHTRLPPLLLPFINHCLPASVSPQIQWQLFKVLISCQVSLQIRRTVGDALDIVMHERCLTAVA